jgi:hypothetical protein
VKKEGKGGLKKKKKKKKACGWKIIRENEREKERDGSLWMEDYKRKWSW